MRCSPRQRALCYYRGRPHLIQRLCHDVVDLAFRHQRSFIQPDMVHTVASQLISNVNPQEHEFGFAWNAAMLFLAVAGGAIALFAALTAPSQRLGCSGSRRSSLDKRGTRAAFLIQIPYSAPLPPARKLRGNAARLSEKTSAAAILPQLSQFRPKVWRPFA